MVLNNLEQMGCWNKWAATHMFQNVVRRVCRQCGTEIFSGDVIKLKLGQEYVINPNGMCHSGTKDMLSTGWNIRAARLGNWNIWAVGTYGSSHMGFPGPRVAADRIELSQLAWPSSDADSDC